MTQDDDDLLDAQGEMPWEWKAREAIEAAADKVLADEIRGVMYLQAGLDENLDPIPEEFDSTDAIRQRLLDIGENVWSEYVPYDGGPVIEPSVADIVEDTISRHSIEMFFARVAPPNDVTELTSARAITVPGSGLIVQSDLSAINEELIHYLAQHPEKLHDLNPRKYEELVAEIFRDKGYQVELTPKSKDGGIDIRAFRRSDVGTLLTLIECKRYAPSNPVSVEIVRGLYGVTASEGATRAILATTSRFTGGAKSFQAQNKYKLHLADFEDMKVWLSNYKRRPNLE